MKGSRIEQVEIGMPPGCPSDCPDPSQPDAAWITIRVAAESEGESVRSKWESLLLAGAFRHLSGAQGLPPVLGRSVTIVFPDGRTEDGGEVVISQPLEHDVAEESESSLTSQLESGSAAAETQILSLSFQEPIRLAPLIDVSVSDPRAVNWPEILGQIRGDLVEFKAPSAEGIYVGLHGADGKLVAASAYSVRTGEGVGWNDPAYPELDISGIGGTVG